MFQPRFFQSDGRAFFFRGGTSSFADRFFEFVNLFFGFTHRYFTNLAEDRRGVCDNYPLRDVVDVRGQAILFATRPHDEIDDAVDSRMAERELGRRPRWRNHVVERKVRFRFAICAQASNILADLGIRGTSGFRGAVEQPARALGYSDGVTDHTWGEVDVEVLDFAVAWRTEA